MLTTLTVTSLADLPVLGPGSAPGTLRQAIFDANQSADVDIIQFASGLSGNINLSSADDSFWGGSALVISSPVTIRGNANGVTISRAAANEVRLIHVTTSGALTLESISLTAGIARGLAGADPGQAGGESRGGAIYNEGTLLIIASTLYGNQAIGGDAFGGGAGGGARGGAVFNDQGLLTIRNSTLSGNAVHSGAGTTVSNFGGAVYSLNGTVTVQNSTLTENIATSGRSMYVLGDKGTTTVDITSTIIGQHDAPMTALDLNIPFDAGGQMQVTGANNLIRRQNDYSYITVSTDDPQLASLFNNGGPTMTHALAADSPAINLGSNPAGLTTDQRGATYSRAVGLAPDIGAFELQTVASPALLGDYNLNHVVDAADYALWRKTLGSTVEAYSGADGNGNGSVDIVDYGIWRTNFGATSAASGVAIQESSGSQLDSEVPDASTLPHDAAGADAIITSLELVLRQTISEIPRLGSTLSPLASAEEAIDDSDESADALLTIATRHSVPDHDFASISTLMSRDVADEQPDSLVLAGALDVVFAAWPRVT